MFRFGPHEGSASALALVLPLLKSILKADAAVEGRGGLALGHACDLDGPGASGFSAPDAFRHQCAAQAAPLVGVFRPHRLEWTDGVSRIRPTAAVRRDVAVVRADAEIQLRSVMGALARALDHLRPSAPRQVTRRFGRAGTLVAEPEIRWQQRRRRPEGATSASCPGPEFAGTPPPSTACTGPGHAHRRSWRPETRPTPTGRRGEPRSSEPPSPARRSRRSAARRGRPRILQRAPRSPSTGRRSRRPHPLRACPPRLSCGRDRSSQSPTTTPCWRLPRDRRPDPRSAAQGAAPPPPVHRRPPRTCVPGSPSDPSLRQAVLGSDRAAFSSATRHRWIAVWHDCAPNRDLRSDTRARLDATRRDPGPIAAVPVPHTDVIVQARGVAPKAGRLRLDRSAWGGRAPWPSGPPGLARIRSGTRPHCTFRRYIYSQRNRDHLGDRTPRIRSPGRCPTSGREARASSTGSRCSRRACRYHSPRSLRRRRMGRSGSMVGPARRTPRTRPLDKR